MAKFFRRGTDSSVERLLRRNRPTPRDTFVADVVHRIEREEPTSRRLSPPRYRAALVLALLLAALAAALGGITAASAGVGNIVHAAANIISPAKSETSSGGRQATNSDASPANKAGDVQASSANSQYAILICHVEGHGKVVLKAISPSALPGHLGHGDYYPTNGHC